MSIIKTEYGEITGGGFLAAEFLFVVYNKAPNNNEYHKIGIYDFATGEAKTGIHYYTNGTGHNMSGNNIEYKSKSTGYYTVVAKNDYYLYKFDGVAGSNQPTLTLVGQNATEDTYLAYPQCIYFVSKTQISFDETYLGNI